MGNYDVNYRALVDALGRIFPRSRKDDLSPEANAHVVTAEQFETVVTTVDTTKIPYKIERGGFAIELTKCPNLGSFISIAFHGAEGKTQGAKLYLGSRIEIPRGFKYFFAVDASENGDFEFCITKDVYATHESKSRAVDDFLAHGPAVNGAFQADVAAELDAPGAVFPRTLLVENLGPNDVYAGASAGTDTAALGMKIAPNGALSLDLEIGQRLFLFCAVAQVSPNDTRWTRV